MKFGLFLQPVHHVSRDPTEALEDDFALVEQLDALGYDEVWVGEHHSTGWENIAAPELFIAAAAERTKQIRLGTGVVQLGLHHPLVVLDRMILLDHMTRGRGMTPSPASKRSKKSPGVSEGSCSPPETGPALRPPNAAGSCSPVMSPRGSGGTGARSSGGGLASRP